MTLSDEIPQDDQLSPSQIPVPTPRVGRLGMGYIWELPEHGVSIHLDYLVPRGRELSGEFEVYLGGKFILQGIHSLNSTESRDRLTQALAKRTNGVVPWDKILTLFCAAVMRKEREGESTKHTQDLPVSQVSYLIDKIVQEHKANLLFGPGGCIAAETLIEGPNGAERADVLCERGTPFVVWSLGPKGPVPAIAGPVYKKGITDLYEYKFANGQSVIATLEHRFLTPTGWQSGDEVQLGELFALSSHELPGSKSFSRSMSHEGDQHSSQTTADSKDHYLTGFHQYGQQLLCESNSDQEFPPLSIGAHEHNRPYWRMDDSVALEEYNHVYQLNDRHSKNNYVPFELLPVEQEFHYVQEHSLWRDANILTRPQFLPLTNYSSNIHESYQSVISSAVVPQLPPSESLYYSTLVSRTKLREDVYYDLTVPDYENYSANGLWHHNSGKGFLAIATCIAVSVCRGIGPLSVKPAVPFYFDWEDDFETFNARVKLICAGLNIPIPHIPYRRMHGKLTDNIIAIARAMAKENANYGIIDSVSACAGSPSSGDTWDSLAHRMFDALDHVIDSGGQQMTWLLICHVTGDSATRSDSVAGKPFGSIQQLNRARCAWELRSQQEDGSDTVSATLYHAKWNHTGKKAPIGLSFYFDEDAVRISAGTAIRPRNSLADKLSDHFNQHGHASLRALSLALQVKEDTIRYEMLRHPMKFTCDTAGFWDLVTIIPAYQQPTDTKPTDPTNDSLPW